MASPLFYYDGEYIMMRKRQVASGIVSRRIPSNTVCQTVFGTQELAETYCPACRKFKYNFEFYKESISKSKYPDQLRTQCVECWDIYHGSTDYDNSFYLAKLQKKAMNDA